MLLNIMYLLTEWEGRTGKYLAYGPSAASQSISILLYDHRGFPFFSSFFFRVIKFVMFTYVAHFDRKFMKQQSCFSSHLARAIDKIPV